MKSSSRGAGVTAWASWAEYRRTEQQTLDLPAGGDLSCAFLFPADYSVGMANLGYHYIYRALRESGVAVERFFLTPIPYRSVERDTMLERFPLILASISYEADILHFAQWLQQGGISPSRRTREEKGQPMIGIGGAITYINPLPICEIADFALLGDGIPLIPHLVGSLRNNRSRDAALRALGEHPSFFVPQLHIDEEKGHAKLEISRRTNLADDYGHGTWITPNTVFGNTLLVELQRGCIRGCRYCTLPSCFAPFRQRPVDLVHRDIARVASDCTFEQVGLVTPEASDYEHLEQLLDFVATLGKGVSFASLRADGLTERTIEALSSRGRKSITIAPESGDDDLRVSCGKTFTNELILDVLAMAERHGMTNVKLYFMIGLPGETEAHIEAIATLCAAIKRKTKLRLNTAVSPFVPKPGTAWRNAPFEEERRLKKKYMHLANLFKRTVKETLQPISVKEASLEYALSWGTTCASRNIAEAGDKNGMLRELSRDIDRANTTRELRNLGLQL